MSSITPFQFDKVDVRVVLDENSEPWFVAKDVAVALGYVDTTQAVRTHCVSAKRLKDISKNVKGVSGTPLHPQTKMIPEGDVYKLTMASTLPSAKRFQDWVCNEVLPEIRKTGSYNLKSLKDDQEWRELRDDGKSARKDFAREIKQRGATTKWHFAELSDKVNIAALGMRSRELKQCVAHYDGITDPKKIKNITVRDNLNGELLSKLIMVERGSTNRMIAKDVHGVKNCGKTIEEVGNLLEALLSGKDLQVV